VRRRREREGERDAREATRLEVDVAESVGALPSEGIPPIVAVRLAPLRAGSAEQQRLALGRSASTGR
jgi:hypothetical protein